MFCTGGDDIAPFGAGRQYAVHPFHILQIAFGIHIGKVDTPQFACFYLVVLCHIGVPYAEQSLSQVAVDTHGCGIAVVFVPSVLLVELC